MELDEQFLGSWFHWFPPVGIDLSQHLTYDSSDHTFQKSARSGVILQKIPTNTTLKAIREDSI